MLFAGMIDWTAMLNPPKVPQGGILDLRITPLSVVENQPEFRVKWKSLEVTPFQNPRNKKEWVALFAIPRNATLGNEEILVNGRKLEFHVIDAKFKTEGLKVDPRKVKLNEKDKARAKEEREEIHAIYASKEITPVWNGNFIKPIESVIKSVYGTKRLFNGEESGHHTGVDLRAGVGAKVRASNDGKVRLAKELFYAGNLVLIEHGGGVYTNYAHLSRIDVKVGDNVTKNQVIGLSGATGRVSGPHLHWGVRIHGQEANPLDLLNLKFSQ